MVKQNVSKLLLPSINNLESLASRNQKTKNKKKVVEEA